MTESRHPLRPSPYVSGAASGPKKTTIYDLARHTGFSPGTVSRVLNNRDKVAPATRRTILEAARELDLKPQVSVRARQVALLSEPTFTDRIEGYAATLTAHLSFAFSRRCIGVMLPSDPIGQISGLFLDGIIAVTFDKALEQSLQQLEQPVPVIFMDYFGANPDAIRVCSDHYRSGYLAAEHFIQRGKKKLAYFGGEGAAFAERLRGYRDAMVAYGVTVDDGLLVMAARHEHQSVVTRLVRRGADSMYVPGTSFQVLECLHLLTYVMGKRVPEDLAIIGGENEGISQYQHPPLTTIEEPLREMAETAVDIMDRLTSGESIGSPSVLLPVKLIERNSAG